MSPDGGTRTGRGPSRGRYRVVPAPRHVETTISKNGGSANAAANAVYAELAADQPQFAKILSAYMAFRNDEYLWFQVGEVAYDNYLVRARAKG